jgi:hypothetical protein
MIAEWFIGIWSNGVAWIFTLLPTFATTGINAGLSAILGPFSDGVNSLGAWLPWSTVQVWLPITISLYVAGLTIRAVKSFIPTISG